jgi:hypothetical protein
MDLSPSPSQGPEYFRVYSDREQAPGKFVWNPTMDLLAVLSSADESAVSVHRLLPDDDEPYLFHEQLPFAASAVGWHPSGRELAVGDVHGNVFILTAEPEDERRLHEVQKLHGSAVASLCWISFGAILPEDSVRLPSSFYSYAKLPLASIDGHASEPSFPPSSLLASLSESGHISFLVDGWLPVADIRLPTTDGCTHVDLALHPGSTEVVTLAHDNLNPHDYIVYILDTRSLGKAQSAIQLTAEIERDALNVLKRLHTLTEHCSRLLSMLHEEFTTKIDISGLSSATPKPTIARIDEIFSAAKLTKWEKRLSELLDELLVHCFVNFEILADEFMIIACELKTCCATKLPSESVKLEVRKFAHEFKLKFHAYKEVCRLVNDVVIHSDGLGDRPFKSIADAASSGIFDQLQTTTLKAVIKTAEIGIHQFLANERERNSTGLKIDACFKVSGAMVRPALTWKLSPMARKPEPEIPDFFLEFLWVSGENKNLLHVVRIDSEQIGQGGLSSQGQIRKVVLDMGDMSSWLQFTSYRDEICACVGNDGGSSVCLMSLDCVRPVDGWAEISAVESYRIPVDDLCSDCVKAQQLPVGFEEIHGLAVSSTRKLASVLGSTRLITIDLEPQDE